MHNGMQRLVKLNVGVWHLAAMPIHLDTAHVMITLPERIYKTDCVVICFDFSSAIMYNQNKQQIIRRLVS